MNKLLARIAGPLCIIVDLAILVDLAIDIHHKIKTRRRARKMAAAADDFPAEAPEPTSETSPEEPIPETA